MKMRCLPPAAALVAALLVLVPGSSRAERPPTRPLLPSEEVIDSDPWRPDSGLPGRTLATPGERLLDGASRNASQPVLQRESWWRYVLRFLRSFLIGGTR